MGKLKRFGIGAGITAVLLSGLTAFWYQGHYTIPPIEEARLIPISPNGFDTLQEAIKLTILERDGIAVSPKPLPGSSFPIRYPNQPLAGRLKLVKANEAAIARTREALAQEYRAPSHSSTEVNGIHLRNQARMLVFAGTAYADAGNLDEAARCYLDAMDLGIAIPHGGRIMPLLYGHSCETLGRAAMDPLVETLDARGARAAAERLEKLESKRVSFSEVLKQENHSLYHEMANLFTTSPFTAWKNVGKTYGSMNDFSSLVMGQEEASRSPSAADRAQQLAIQAILTYQGPGQTITELSRWTDRVIAQSELPWGPQRPPLEEPKGSVLAYLIGPMFRQAEFHDVHARTTTALLTTRLRLRTLFLETGRYPATLEKVPVDLFSPTRSPLGYRSTGKTYTLWSVGPDAKDDGGTPVASPGGDKKRKPSINVTSQGDIVT